jgi:hypothetical protein
MSFHDQWKTAKTTFERTTQGKKPSEKVKNAWFSSKGTGIAAALKEMDAAKTAKQANSALTTFATAADEYYRVLDTAVKDTSSFPNKVDAATYKSAVEALQKALAALRAQGKSLHADLDGKEKKAAVNLQAMAAQRKAEDEQMLALKGAEDHLKLRKKMAGETDNWAKKASQDLKTVEAQLAKMKTYQDGADIAQASGLTKDAAQWEARATTLLQEAKKLYADCEKEEKERTKQSGDLMEARGDVKSKLNKLSPQQSQKLGGEMNQAFGTLDANQRTWQANLRKIKAIVAELEAAVDEIEAGNGKIKAPAEYLKWLTPEAKKWVEFRDSADTTAVKVEGYLKTNLPEWQKTKMDAGLRKTVTGMDGILQGLLQKMNQRKAQVEPVKKRLSLVASASKDPAVTKVIADIRADIQKFETFNTRFQAAYNKAEPLFKAQLNRKDGS